MRFLVLALSITSSFAMAKDLSKEVVVSPQQLAIGKNLPQKMMIVRRNLKNPKDVAVLKIKDVPAQGARALAAESKFDQVTDAAERETLVFDATKDDDERALSRSTPAMRGYRGGFGYRGGGIAVGPRGGAVAWRGGAVGWRGGAWRGGAIGWGARAAYYGGAGYYGAGYYGGDGYWPDQGEYFADTYPMYATYAYGGYNYPLTDVYDTWADVGLGYSYQYCGCPVRYCGQWW